jgi:hypothetical protein
MLEGTTRDHLEVIGREDASPVPLITHPQFLLESPHQRECMTFSSAGADPLSGQRLHAK